MLKNPIIKFLGCLFFCIQSPKFFRSSLVSSFLVLLLNFFCHMTLWFGSTGPVSILSQFFP